MSSNWCAGTGGVLVATRSDVLLLCQVALFRHDLEHAVAELLRDFIQVSALGPDHHTAVHHPTEVGQSRWAARRGGSNGCIRRGVSAEPTCYGYQRGIVVGKKAMRIGMRM